MDKFYKNFGVANHFIRKIGYFQYINECVVLSCSYDRSKVKMQNPYSVVIETAFSSEQDFETSKNKVDNIADIYFELKKDKQLEAKDMVFADIVIKMYCAYGYIYDIEKDIPFQIAGKLLFIINYVYNNIKLKTIPYFWKDIENIILTNYFKTLNAVESALEDKNLLNAMLPVAQNFKNSVEFKYKKGAIKRQRFEKMFSDGLAIDATKKLKKDATYIERKEHPVQTRFFNKYPFFSTMANLFKIETSLEECKKRDIYYGAVDFYSKVIYINEFNIKGDNFDNYMDFIFAHEMLHIALNHMGRKKNRDMLKWNLACDFVINHWLVEMQVGFAPENIYLDSTLAGLSAEEIYLKISESESLLRKMNTMRDIEAGHGFKRMNEKSKKSSVDMFGEDESKKYGDLHDAACKAMLQGYHLHKNMGRGALPAGLEEEIKVLEQPSIPWEVELATWISYNLPLDEKRRSYSRVSRRPSISPDMPLPKWLVPMNEKKSKTFGVVLDTSGSMDRELLGKCLGAIAAYAKQNDVLQVRLICCDTKPYDLGYVNVDEIKNKMKLFGRGGTILQPAFDYLESQADFPIYAPILVLTDGYFEPGLKTSRASAYLVPEKNLIKGYRNVFEFS